MGPSPYLWFLHSKQRLLEQNYKALWVSDPTCGFWMQNSDFWNRITSFYGFQPSSVVLCVENSDFRTKIACLYGSLNSHVIFCMQNSMPSIRNTSLYVSQPSSVVFECKTATLGPELQVSMGHSPHLWFLHAKQRLLDPNSKSLWVPDITCRFVPAIQRD